MLLAGNDAAFSIWHDTQTDRDYLWLCSTHASARSPIHEGSSAITCQPTGKLHICCCWANS